MVLIAKHTSERIKLDVYDKKLIFLLSQDMRAKRKDLAKFLRISEDKVNYKINRLMRELLSPAVDLDLVMLGFHNSVILVERLDQSSADRLLEHPDLIMYFRILGRNQYILIVSTQDLDAFCKAYLSEAQFTAHEIVSFIPDDYNPYHLDLKPIPLPRRGMMDLGPRDYALLAHLAKNPISSSLEISKAIRMDRSMIKKRIEDLKQAGVIQKFRYGIDIFKMGLLVYFIKLQLTPASRKKLIPFLRSDDYSGFIYETLDGLFMFYMPPNQRPLFDFTARITQRDPQAKIEILQATDYFKVEPLPKGVIPVLRARAGID